MILTATHAKDLGNTKMEKDWLDIIQKHSKEWRNGDAFRELQFNRHAPSHPSPFFEPAVRGYFCWKCPEADGKIKLYTRAKSQCQQCALHPENKVWVQVSSSKVCWPVTPPPESFEPTNTIRAGPSPPANRFSVFLLRLQADAAIAAANSFDVYSSPEMQSVIQSLAWTNFVEDEKFRVFLTAARGHGDSPLVRSLTEEELACVEANVYACGKYCYLVFGLAPNIEPGVLDKLNKILSLVPDDQEAKSAKAPKGSSFHGYMRTFTDFVAFAIRVMRSRPAFRELFQWEPVFVADLEHLCSCTGSLKNAK